MAYEDPAYDDTLDPEGPSADDIARFGRDGSDCPSCGAEVFDDATVCPICGDLLTRDTSTTKPWAALVAGAIVLAFVLFYIL
ncbi:MAG: hypothetical protein AAFZ67_00375 [Planctomycetota bacterium]